METTSSLKMAAGLRRAVAAGALVAETKASLRDSFLADDIQSACPDVTIEGALPATGLGYSPAEKLHMLVDLATLWGFGDFDDTLGCSRYYDPNSAWYNGFFGGYAMRSYKLDNTPWGYKANGEVDFDEFFKVCAVDYNFITAGAFGCPPDKMCFSVDPNYTPCKVGNWDVASVTAYAPSGLHNPAEYTPTEVGSYLIFGLPHPGLLNGGDSFAKVELKAKFYLRRWPLASKGRPVSLAWGAAYHNTNAGQALLDATMAAMEEKYLKLGE